MLLGSGYLVLAPAIEALEWFAVVYPAYHFSSTRTECCEGFA